MRTSSVSDAEIQLFDGICSLRWMGTNCLIIKTKDTCLMVDPHFSRPGLPALTRKIAPQIGKIQQALDRLDLTGLNAILITHTHYDHFLDALKIASLTKADIYGSESVVQAAGRDLLSSQVHRAEHGIPFCIGEIKVTFYESSHLEFFRKLAGIVNINGSIDHPINPPVWFWQYRAGTVYSFLLEMEGHRIYIQGSAGIKNLAIPSAETAILSIAGLGFKSRQYRQLWFNQIVLQTGAREVYFSHCDNFFIPWNAAARDFPGTRRVIRCINQMSAACPDVKFKRLIPG